MHAFDPLNSLTEKPLNSWGASCALRCGRRLYPPWQEELAKVRGTSPLAPAAIASIFSCRDAVSYCGVYRR